jgi:hypothetical protein
MKRIGPTSVVLATALLTTVASAWAEAPTTICVPEHASSQVLSTNTKGECPSKVISKTTVKYKVEALPGTAELEKLDKLLPHVSYVESGVGGKPTIQFSGVNVQVVNGEGKTASTNGEGNLVIGYDEGSAAQTGSHNLILGEEQTVTSYGGIVGGSFNSITAPGASVLSGTSNTASGPFAVVLTGSTNRAKGTHSWVGGGEVDEADARLSSVFGGFAIVASQEYEAVP